MKTSIEYKKKKNGIIIVIHWAIASLVGTRYCLWPQGAVKCTEVQESSALCKRKKLRCRVSGIISCNLSLFMKSVKQYIADNTEQESQMQNKTRSVKDICA